MRRHRKRQCLLCCIIFLGVLVLMYTRPISHPKIRRSCGLARGNARYIIPYRGSCFYIPKESMNWFSGMRHCLLNNLTLATLDEKAKLQLISRHCRHNQMRQEYWFGGTELGGGTNEFWYISNGQLIDYFGKHRPVREADGQHCLKLNIHYNTTHVATDSCEAAHPVICERVERL